MVRTSAPNSSSGLYVDENPGSSTIGTSIVAADKNMIQEELANAVEDFGLALSAGNNAQLYQVLKGCQVGYPGALVQMEFEVPTSITFPAVPRYDADRDISQTNYPLLVPLLRAVKAKVLGVTDFASTVAGSVITLTSTAASLALVKLINEDAGVNGWLLTQSATYTPDYSTAATRRTVNVAGTDYAITAVNLLTPSITVSGTPASGAQTVSCYTYRIAGSATTARLHRLSGFVGVVAGDVDGEHVGGWRKMDRGQGHRNAPLSSSNFPVNTPGSGVISLTSGTNYALAASTGDPVTDTVNGTPRTGKTTNPRSHSLYAYTAAGIYVP